MKLQNIFKYILLSAVTSIYMLLPTNASASLTGDEIQAQLLPATKDSPQQISLRIQVKIHPGWHVYGLKPGEMGLPPKLSLTLPDGFVAGDINWPADHEFEIGEYHCAGYSSDFVVQAPIKIADVAKAKSSAAAAISMSWLACDGDTCVPGKAELSAPLNIQ